jgi:mannosyltransferase OCH1-like enzyme
MIPRILFTSYLCDISDPIIQSIIEKWQTLNSDFKVLYFSDSDVDIFFNNHDHTINEIYKKLRNGVAKADFFRICYINKYGGYWFDIDLEPIIINVPRKGDIHLFDAGFGNISYMFIGGNIKQKLFDEVIEEVSNRILDNYNKPADEVKHILYVTGPRIIQNILQDKLNIPILDGSFKGTNESVSYMENTDYEFEYQKIEFITYKTEIYNKLQIQYNKKNYAEYKFI